MSKDNCPECGHPSHKPRECAHVYVGELPGHEGYCGYRYVAKYAFSESVAEIWCGECEHHGKCEDAPYGGGLLGIDCKRKRDAYTSCILALHEQEVKPLADKLLGILEIVESAMGDWVGIATTYIPENLMPYREIQEILNPSKEVKIDAALKEVVK